MATRKSASGTGKTGRPNVSSRLDRTEVVGVRLDPRLKYLAELAARSEHRTLSSYIERVIADSLYRVEMMDRSTGRPETIGDQARLLWDLDPAERLLQLALRYPELMSLDEQAKWKALCEAGAVEDRAPLIARGDAPGDADPIFQGVRSAAFRARFQALGEAFKSGPAAIEEWVRTTRDAIEHGRAQP